MATYTELRGLFGDGDIRKKVEVAVVIAAQTILDGGDDTDPPWDQTAGQHDIRVKWAHKALTNTGPIAEQIHKYVLAANEVLTGSQIQNATDSAIQNNVNGAIDELAKAEFGA